MTNFDRFGKPNTTTPAAPPAASTRARYAGITCADTRDPLLAEGAYRCKVVQCVKGQNQGTMRESYKVTVQVLNALDGAQSREGGTYVCLFNLSANAGVKESKAFIVAAAGFAPTMEEIAADPVAAKNTRIAGEQAFDALDTSFDGNPAAILMASAGEAVPGAPSVVGRTVDVVVERGKERDDGDYFRRFVWASVGEPLTA